MLQNTHSTQATHAQGSQLRNTHTAHTGHGQATHTDPTHQEAALPAFTHHGQVTTPSTMTRPPDTHTFPRSAPRTPPAALLSEPGGVGGLGRSARVSVRSSEGPWTGGVDVTGLVDFHYDSDPHALELRDYNAPSQPDGAGYEFEAELHLEFRTVNGMLTVSVLGARCCTTQQGRQQGLYDLPEFPSTTSTPRASVHSSTHTSSQITFPTWPEFDHATFWVEGFVRNHMQRETDIRYTCQCIVEGEKNYAPDGSVSGHQYRVVFEDVCWCFDLEAVLANITAPPNGHTPQSSMRDGLDFYAQKSAHLVLLLHMGLEAIGEVWFPLHTGALESPTAWYPLRPVDQSFSSRLRRTRRGWDARLWEDSKGQRGRHTRVWAWVPRKVVSLRSLFILLIFAQIAFVITSTALVLAFTANTELTNSAEVLAYSVQSKINKELQSQLNAPLAYVASTQAYLLHMAAPRNRTDNLHFLAVNYQNTRAAGLIVSNNFFVGYPSQQFYGVGVGYANFEAPPELSKDLDSLMTYTLEDPEQGTNVSMYGWNIDCLPANYSCEPSNTSDPNFPWTNINVSARVWYRKAIANERAIWTDVYLYITGVLGITAATRIPRSLSEPVKVVAATDITLNEIDSLLGALNYYKSGYGFLVGAKSGYLIATSLPNAPVVVDNKRVFANESSVFRIRQVARNLQEVCPPGTEYPFLCALNSTPENKTLGFSNAIVSINRFDYLDVDDVWAMVVVIPRADFEGVFKHMLMISILCSIVLTIVCIIVTVMVVNTVTIQLIRCTRQLARFAKLDFSTRVPESGLRSPVKEISRIYKALQSMRLSLRSFYKYVPPEVVRMLVDSNQEAQLGSQKKQLTVFVSDVVDFTTIAERLKPEELIEVLGEYLNEMSHIVTSNEGVVDKYIGDAIMALWNAPENVIDHPRKACEAALFCHKVLAFLQREWQERGYPSIRARIGVHTGVAIVGNIGARTRLSYTAIGDTVNLAERLEGLNKNYGTSIMVSEDTHYYIRNDFVCRPLDAVPASRRKSGVLLVYELIGHKTITTEKEKKAAYMFSRAYQQYLQREFRHAHEGFEAYRNLYNRNDRSAILHIASCIHYHLSPPPSDWKGLRHNYKRSEDHDE